MESFGKAIAMILVGIPLTYGWYRIFREFVGPHLVRDSWSRGNTYMNFYLMTWVLYLAIAPKFFF